MKKIAAGIDVGGTNTKAGLISQDMEILALEVCSTVKENEEAFVEQIVGTIDKLKSKADCGKIDGLGIGVPGFVDENRQTVITTVGFIEYMDNLNLAELLSKATGLPVKVDNDALVYTLGEYSCLDNPVRSFVVITLGTGVGVGWIYEGKRVPPPDRGAMAGHMGISLDRHRCYCGGTGCAESYLSATGFVEIAKSAIKEHPETKLADYGEHLTAKDIIEQAEHDSLAAELVNRYIQNLEVYLQAIFHGFAADMIVIGGGLAQGLVKWQDKLQKICDGFIRYDGRRTIVRISTLGETAGVLGGAALVFDRLIMKG